MTIHSDSVENEIRIRLHKLNEALVTIQNGADLKVPLFKILDQSLAISRITFALIKQEEIK